MTRSAHLLLGSALAATLVLPLRASGPTRWSVSSADQWLQGRSDQVAVDRDGRITLGPTLREVHEDDAPSIWDVVVAPDGTAYAGTGNDGRVLAYDGKNARTLFDSDELQVHAVVWHDRYLLAGSSPSGKVYEIDSNGTHRVFFDPEDTYIWAMLVAPDGDVFVATGNKARVHRVSRDGSKSKVVFESTAANVTALALASDGQLLVGTDTPGRLYRVPADGGRAFALMDGPHTQIQAIRPLASGGAYVLAVSPSSDGAATAAPASTTSAGSTPSVTTEVTIVAVGDAATTASATTSASPTASSATGGKGKGTVYTLTAQGLTETYWDATTELPFAMNLEENGTVLVTTAGGTLYRLEGSPVRVSRLGQTASEQITRMTKMGDRYLLAGANPGKLYTLDASPARAGSYTSDVRDAAAGASWGLLQWDGVVPSAAKADFETRSGNTSTPDETWSDWAALRADAPVQRIASPAARYLQWRVALSANRSGEAPVLDGVTVTYLSANRRPRLTSVTLHGPGVVFQQPFGTQEPPELAGYQSTTPAPARDRAIEVTQSGSTSAAVGRRLYQKGFQTLQWDAQDPDGDDLRFAIRLRRVGTDGWTDLARDLVGTVYTWDTTQQADGRYYARIIVTDSRANPAGLALEGERERGPFTVDNTPPLVTADEPKRDQPLRFTVADATSPLARVDLLQADGQWRPLFPVDGVMDALEERFDVPRAALGDGPVVIRAADTLANISTRELPAPAAAAAPRR